MVRIFLADDHVCIRQAMAGLLSEQADIAVSGDAGVGEEALAALKDTPCDLYLLSMSGSDRQGLDHLRHLHRAFPETPVLVLGMHSEEYFAVRCIRNGARGYLCKTSTADEVIAGIRRVAAGQMLLKASLTQELALTMLSKDERDQHARLSRREFVVFRHLIAGLAVTRIARELDISVKTVSTHKTRIQKKLRCDGVAGMVRYAQEHDLLEDAPGQS